MSELRRTCSECGNSLAGKLPQCRTCSAKCRQARSIRLRAEARGDKRDTNTRNAMSKGAREITDIVRRYEPDEIKNVLHEELAPIVRDALTEETLRSVKRMLGLTPRAVDALSEDLDSEDPVIRQRAASLVVKYTIGHPALVKADDADGSKQIVVNFELPRPNAIEGVPDFTEAVEVKTCDLCDIEKPSTDFVAGSARCQDCADEWKRKITEQFA